MTNILLKEIIEPLKESLSNWDLVTELPNQEVLENKNKLAILHVNSS